MAVISNRAAHRAGGYTRTRDAAESEDTGKKWSDAMVALAIAYNKGGMTPGEFRSKADAISAEFK